MNTDHLKTSQCANQFLHSIELLDAEKAIEALQGFRLEGPQWGGDFLWKNLMPFVGDEGDEFNDIPPTITKAGLAFLEQVLPVCFEKGFNPLQDIPFENTLRYLNTPFYPLVARLCRQYDKREEFGGTFYHAMTEIGYLHEDLYQGAEGYLHETNNDGQTVLHVVFHGPSMWMDLAGGALPENYHRALDTIISMGGDWHAEDIGGHTPLDRMQASYDVFSSLSSQQRLRPEALEKAQAFLTYYIKQHIQEAVSEYGFSKPNKSLKKM